MKRLILFLFITTVVVTTSCKKQTNTPVPSEPETLDEMVFPSDFDWKTYNNISISVTGYATSILEIKSTEGVVYQKLVLHKNTPYTGKITVPSYETEVHLVYMGQDVVFELGNETISHQFN